MVITAEDEFRLLVRKISNSSGILLTGYRENYLRRRIDLRMKVLGIESYITYVRFLENNPDELKEAINAITVNVTEFMRDKTPFLFFRKEILPEIMERKKKVKSSLARFWSAACSNGEEPYSIGICSREALPEDWSVSIYATDIDENCLMRASQGIYSKEQLKNLEPALVQKYFTPCGRDFKIIVNKNLSVRFKKHDLTSESPISKHFDAVFCRNVMIYFNEKQKIKMLTNFNEALSDGGYLIIGKSETLPPEIRELFVPINVREKIFQKAEQKKFYIS